jgi:hypothetical protein
MTEIDQAPEPLFTMTAVLPERESPITVYSLPAKAVEDFRQKIFVGLDRKDCVLLCHDGVQLLFPSVALSNTVFLFHPEE